MYNNKVPEIFISIPHRADVYFYIVMPSLLTDRLAYVRHC